MNSDRRCGRSFSSNEESSPTGAAETRRSRFGSTSRLFLALATDPDSRTKCESAQLHFLEVGPPVTLGGLQRLGQAVMPHSVKQSQNPHPPAKSAGRVGHP